MSQIEKMSRKILQIEINELPLSVIRSFSNHNKLPHLKAFFQGANVWKTKIDSAVAEDISPWTAWPTYHRGMNVFEHCIYSPSQNPDTFRGRSLWEELHKNNKSIGVFGSLHSWPAKNYGRESFYVPDKYARTSECYPDYLQPFQKIYLDVMHNEVKAPNMETFFSQETMSLLQSVQRLNLSWPSIKKTWTQLYMERLDPVRKARRGSLVALLRWEVFKAVYPKYLPDFSTFYTDHIGSLLKRYWHHVYPEEYGDKYKSLAKVHLSSVVYGLEVLDQVLADALGWTILNPDLVIVLISPSGLKKGDHVRGHGYRLQINDLEKLTSLLGIHADEFLLKYISPMEASAEIKDFEIREAFFQRLGELRANSGKPLFKVREFGSRIDFSLNNISRDDIYFGQMKYSFGQDEVYYTWDEVGFKVIQIEYETADIDSAGVFAIYGQKLPFFEKNEEIIELSKCRDILMSIMS